MKKLKLLCGVLTLISLTSCNPRVITNLTKTYPTLSPDSVVVYNFGDTIPKNAEIIGSVAVIDGGLTTKCKYDYVVSLAKNVTAKSGGNGFAIREHAKPSFWGSSCHQVRGAILHITNPQSYVSKEDSFILVNKDFVTEVRKQRCTNQKSQHIVSVNAGAGLISSDFFDERNKNYSGKGGVAFSINYEWTSKKGIGAGLVCSYTEFLLNSATIDLTYIAPQFVYKFINNKWAFGCGAGVGCFKYKESGYQYSIIESNIGFNTKLSVDYRISKHFGLGISTDYILGKMPESTKPNNEKYTFSGLEYFNILGGLKYYF